MVDSGGPDSVQKVVDQKEVQILDEFIGLITVYQLESLKAEEYLNFKKF